MHISWDILYLPLWEVIEEQQDTPLAYLDSRSAEPNMPTLEGKTVLQDFELTIVELTAGIDEFDTRVACLHDPQRLYELTYEGNWKMRTM